MVAPDLYFAVVRHHDAAEGGDGAGELREEMKSTMIERWEGVNWPYQMRLMAILPFNRGPLWYFSTRGCSFTKAENEGETISVVIERNTKRGE